MNKQDIINYVLKTPSNTNPAVLSTMLDEISEGGSCDFSIAAVTITNNLPDTYAYIRASIATEGSQSPFVIPAQSHYEVDIGYEESTTVGVILYKGLAALQIINDNDELLTGFPVTGDIDAQAAGYTISGNGTISLTV